MRNTFDRARSSMGIGICARRAFVASLALFLMASATACDSLPVPLKITDGPVDLHHTAPVLDPLVSAEVTAALAGSWRPDSAVTVLPEHKGVIQSIDFSSDGGLKTMVASDGGVFPTTGWWEASGPGSVTLFFGTRMRAPGAYRFTARGDALNLALVTGDSWATGDATSTAKPTVVYHRRR